MNLSSSLCKGSERKDLKDSKSYRLSKQHSNPVSSCLPRPSLLHVSFYTVLREALSHQTPDVVASAGSRDPSLVSRMFFTLVPTEERQET